MTCLITERDPYRSRTGDVHSVLPRQVPVVYPGKDGQLWEGPLTLDQLQFFEENGYLVLPQYFDENDLNRMWREKDRLIEELDESDPRWICEPESNALRSIYGLQQVSDVYASLSRARKLAGAAQQILGSAVYIHQSRLNLKHGFEGREFFWHSDFETFHMEDGMPEMRALSCCIALTENFEHNAPLMVIPGSHRVYIRCPEAKKSAAGNPLRRQEEGIPPNHLIQDLANSSGIKSLTGKPGTTVFFDANLLHGSGLNMTPYPRHNLFFVYNSVHNPLNAPYSGRPPRPLAITHRVPEPLGIQTEEFL